MINSDLRGGSSVGRSDGGGSDIEGIGFGVLFDPALDDFVEHFC